MFIYKLLQRIDRYYAQVLLMGAFRAGSMLVNILYVPILVDYLSVERFGIWIVLTNIINWLRLFDVGIGNGLQNRLATALSNDNIPLARELVSTTYLVLSCIFGFLIFVFLVINPTINWRSILNTDAVPSVELYHVTNIAVTAIMLGFVMQLITVIYSAIGHTATGAGLQFFTNICSLILVWFLAENSYANRLEFVALAVFGVSVIVYFLFTFYSFAGKFKNIMPSFKYVSLSKSRDLLKLSLDFFVVQITAAIIFSSTPYLIVSLFGPKEVASYYAVNNILSIPAQLFSLLISPVVPLVTISLAKGDRLWLSKTLRKLKHFSYVLVCIEIGLVLMYPWILSFWLDSKIENSPLLTVAVGGNACIGILVTPYSSFLNGFGKLKILVLTAPIGIFVFLAGSFLLSNIFPNPAMVIFALAAANLIGLYLLPREIRFLMSKS